MTFSKEGGDFYSVGEVDFQAFYSYQIIPLIIFSCFVSFMSWNREFSSRNIFTVFKLDEKLSLINAAKFSSNLLISYGMFLSTYIFIITTYFLGGGDFGVVFSGSITIFFFVFFIVSFSTTMGLLCGGRYTGGILSMLLLVIIFLLSIPSISRVFFNTATNKVSWVYDFLVQGVSGNLSAFSFYLLFIISIGFLQIPKFIKKDRLLKSL